RACPVPYTTRFRSVLGRFALGATGVARDHRVGGALLGARRRAGRLARSRLGRLSAQRSGHALLELGLALCARLLGLGGLLVGLVGGALRLGGGRVVGALVAV